jgi:membrane protein implicated in regulation of membrane protease activity
MIVLGFILIVLAAGAVLFALIATGTLTAAPLSAVGVTVSVTPLAMFVAGAVSLLLVVLGLALISRGTKRSVHTRRELRQLRKGQVNQPTAADAAGAGTSRATDGRDSTGPTRTDDRGAGGRPTGAANGVAEERRTSAGDLPSNQRGNEYPPAPR